MNQRGVSLIMSAGIVVIIIMLSMVAMTVVNNNNTLTRSIYSQSITFNGAESAPYLVFADAVDDAPVGYPVFLEDSSVAVLTDKLAYDLFEGVNMEVFVEDNDDGDGSLLDDTDGAVVLHSYGFILDENNNRVGQTHLSALLSYSGNSDKDNYAQEGQNAGSTSEYDQNMDTDWIEQN